MDDQNTYHIPAGFNPCTTLDAIRGLIGALDTFLNEGPGRPGREMSNEDRADLEGLVNVLKREIHALHAYFTALGDHTTLRLPLTDADFDAIHVRHCQRNEVKESAAIYAIR